MRGPRHWERSGMSLARGQAISPLCTHPHGRTGIARELILLIEDDQRELSVQGVDPFGCCPDGHDGG